MEALIHGILLAFGLILPLGVQNVFIFNQGATHNKLLGAFPAVITAAICDTLLIVLAVAGISVVVLSFDSFRMILFLVGFFFLLYMGWSMWRNSPSVGEQGEKFSIRRQITFAASVSLLNPHAILDTIGVIGTSSLVYVGGQKLTFTIACVMVSWLWFIGLAMAGRLIGKLAKSNKLLKGLNKVSAFIIWGMAVFMGYQVLVGLFPLAADG